MSLIGDGTTHDVDVSSSVAAHIVEACVFNGFVPGEHNAHINLSVLMRVNCIHGGEQ